MSDRADRIIKERVAVEAFGDLSKDHGYSAAIELALNILFAFTELEAERHGEDSSKNMTLEGGYRTVTIHAKAAAHDPGHAALITD